MAAQDREKARILQEEAFLSHISKGAKQRLFNQWINAKTTEEREKLHNVAQAVDAAVGFITAEANDYRRGRA